MCAVCSCKSSFVGAPCNAALLLLCHTDFLLPCDAGTEMDAGTYFKMNFKSIVTHKQLTEYTILDVELLGPRQGTVS